MKGMTAATLKIDPHIIFCTIFSHHLQEPLAWVVLCVASVRVGMSPYEIPSVNIMNTRGWTLHSLK